MIPFLADENFDHRIIAAVIRRLPEIDIITVQSVGLLSTDDPKILEWAARKDRILLTHDVSTVTEFAYDRVRGSLPMPGVIEVPKSLSIGAAARDLALFAEASNDGEWNGQVVFLPLK